jgi:hypothetical protein
MAIYQSEYEKFREEMRVQHPDWENAQHEGLNLLWDRKVDFSELRSYGEANERRKAYPYDINFQKSA